MEGGAVGEIAHVETHGAVSWGEAVERFLSLGHGAVRDAAGTGFQTHAILFLFAIFRSRDFPPAVVILGQVNSGFSHGADVDFILRGSHFLGTEWQRWVVLKAALPSPPTSPKVPLFHPHHFCFNLMRNASAAMYYSKPGL